MMSYIITRYEYKTKKSRKPVLVDVAAFDTLQKAIDACKATGLVYAGKTYVGGFVQYGNRNNSGGLWTVRGEYTMPDGTKLQASYDIGVEIKF